MIELARFRWATDEWCLAIGHDRQPRLLSSASDRRTYMICWSGHVGRIVPASAVAVPSARVPWEGWYCSLVYLGDEERRKLFYTEWPTPGRGHTACDQHPARAPRDGAAEGRK